MAGTVMTAADINNRTTRPVEVVLERLRAAGKQVRQSRPDQWEVQCPAHDDTNASMGVNETPIGKVLLCCHRGCRPPDICAALGLRLSDLFPADEPGSHAGGLQERARYPYVDADGEVLFTVIRFIDSDGKKTFRQQAASGAWTMRGVRRVVYNLPQVIRSNAENKRIWIVEGEKDAENLQWHVDGAVTTNPGGAGKWRSEYNDDFRDADVTIVADDDTVGRGHADEVATHLRGVARSVRVVLPAEGFKDISDHLKAGRDLSDLRPLDAPAEEAPVPRLKKIDWDSFWKREPRTESWSAWPLIPLGRAVSLYAPAKAGKSTIVLSVTISAATGCRVFGQVNPAEPVRTLYLDYEMTEDDLHERLTEMGYGAGTDLSLLDYVALPSLPPLDTEAGAKELLTAVRDFGSRQVIIDTFGRATEGEENSNDTARAFYRSTGLKLKELGVGYLRTDHAGKDLEKGQRGGSGKNDDVDLVWRLERTANGALLTRTHTRIGWGMSAIPLDRTEDDNGIVSFRMASTSYAKGSGEKAKEMDALGLPLHASRAEARAAGVKGNNQVIADALRWRKAEANALFESSRDRLGTGTYPQGQDNERDSDEHAF